MASDLAGDDLLDRCYCYLEEQWFGILELAMLDPKDANEVAKQIAFAFELNVPLQQHLEGAVRDWILAARRQSDLLRRATGINGDDLEWRSLGPPERASSSQELLRRVENLEERPSCKKGTATESADRSKWLLSVWCDKLRVELVEYGAPVLVSEATEQPGSRPGYLVASREDACYHHEALCYCLSAVATVFERRREKPPPEDPADLIDYLLARRDEPCERIVPELIMKAITWLEKVAEFREDQPRRRQEDELHGL